MVRGRTVSEFQLTLGLAMRFGRWSDPALPRPKRATETTPLEKEEEEEEAEAASTPVGGGRESLNLARQVEVT